MPAAGPPGPAPGRSRSRTDLDVAANPRQPVVQLQRGHRGSAVAEVHDDGRLGRPPQPPPLDVGQPAVHAAEPVRVGGAPGHDADRPVSRHTGRVCRAGALSPVRKREQRRHTPAVVSVDDEIRRVAMVSVHTSPLEQPGTGDAGGMNVYVAEVAKQLAARGVEVDIFTRATTGAVPPIVDMVPGVSVRHITAGPYEGLSKADLPGQLCAFTAGVMRAAAARPEGWYDVLHSHYWLSGQVGWLAADRWGVPLVHTMHTMARVKNLYLPTDDSPEPPGREIGETQVVEAADRLVANTGGRPRSSSSSTTPIPARSASSLPVSTSRPSRPGDQAGGPEEPSASRLPRGSCCSSAASSPSSGPTCCCAPAPSCFAGTRLARRRRSDARRPRRAQRFRPRPLRPPRGARRRARGRGSDPVRPASLRGRS